MRKHTRVHQLANPRYAAKRSQRRNDRDDRLDMIGLLFGGPLEVGL